MSKLHTFDERRIDHRCVFPSHSPDEAKELQLLCCEYLQFEEGKSEERALAKETERVQRLMRGAK
jgi:hypothetical protein